MEVREQKAKGKTIFQYLYSNELTLNLETLFSPSKFDIEIDLELLTTEFMSLKRNNNISLHFGDIRIYI